MSAKQEDSKPPEPSVPDERKRADTFIERKEKARDVGVNTAFVDGLTADLLLGDPAKDDDAKGSEVDADALFDDAPPRDGGPPPSDADPFADAAKLDAKAREDEAPPSKGGEILPPPPPFASAPEAEAPVGTPPLSATPRPPFNPATLAIGAAVLGVVLLLATRTCPSAPDPDSASAAKVADADRDDADPIDDDDDARVDEGGDPAARAGGGAGGGADAHEDADRDGAGAGAAERDADEGAAERDADEGAAGGRDEAGQASAEGADEQAAAAAANDEADDIAVEDDAAGSAGKSAGRDGSSQGGGGTQTWTPSTNTDSDRAAEQGMTAEELLALAKESLKQKRYRDAYRQSGSSYHKKKTDAALLVRVEAACGMNDKDAAKSAFDKLPMGGDRRDLRAKCRNHGVRLGL